MAYVVVATVLALIALVCVLIAAKQRDILALLELKLLP